MSDLTEDERVAIRDAAARDRSDPRSNDGIAMIRAIERIIDARTRAVEQDRKPDLPFVLRMPTNRAGNPDGVNRNAGTDYVDVPVVLDPDMKLRGECRYGYSGDPVIALREWNEQVFLHELLHAVLGYSQPLLTTTHPPHGHEVISRAEVALWEAGWRFRPTERTGGKALSVARNIVNQILDEAGTDVRTRQRINDACDEFAAGLIDRIRQEAVEAALTPIEALADPTGPPDGNNRVTSPLADALFNEWAEMADDIGDYEAGQRLADAAMGVVHRALAAARDAAGRSGGEG